MLLREKLLVCVCVAIVIVGILDLKTSHVNDLWEKTFGFSGRFMIHQGDRIGYVNGRSRLVIAPRFDDGVGYFHEGLAPVSEGKIWGFIGINGQWVIGPRFQSARPFKEHLAAVSQIKDSVRRFGFIGPDGQWKIPAAYAEAGSFSDGLAPVKETGLWGYLTPQGTWAVRPQFEEAREFSQELAAVKIDGRWGYIDRHGLFLIKAQFDEAKPYREGRAAVKVGARWGYIDFRGQWVAQPQFISAGDFFEGLAAVDDSGYIDLNGNPVIKPGTFAEAHAFSEGLAAVRQREPNKFKPSRWGYIDHQGRWVIKPRFETARDFEGAMARVSKDKNNTQRGYIHRNGALVWDPADWERSAASKGRFKMFAVILAALVPFYLIYVLRRRDRQFYYLQTIS